LAKKTSLPFARKVKPTPTPFKKAFWPDETMADKGRFVITDSRGHGVFACLQYGKNAKAEANVDRVILVLNNFDRLVNALSAMIGLIDTATESWSLNHARNFLKSFKEPRG